MLNPMNSWVDSLVFGSPVTQAGVRPKPEGSPYFGAPISDWPEITRELLWNQPLDGTMLVDAVLQSWEDIFESTIGFARIGEHIYPAPQIMGFLLHELVPIRISQMDSNWRRDASASEKDLVFVPDPSLSIEIKTSSHRSQIFGNRSFGIDNPGRGKKAKSGYYCAINFERWSDAPGRIPQITGVRYGWLDSTDWVAQNAQTGQNSTLPAAVYATQLPLLYVQR